MHATMKNIVWNGVSCEICANDQTKLLVSGGSLSSLRLCWLYRLNKIWGLRDHELQMMPLVHPFLWGISQYAILFEVWRRSLSNSFSIFQCSFPNHSSDTSTQFTAVLHPEFLVSCYNFLSYFVSFNNRSRPGISYFRSNFAVFLADSPYAEAIEVVKSRVSLSASLEE
jgi:hypothetical protein